MESYLLISRDGPTVTVRAFGATLHELAENAAAAMFSIGRDLTSIPPTYSRPLVAPGDEVSQLIASWLRELLAVGAEEGIVFSQATVDRLEPGGIQGSAAGQYREDVDRTGPVATGVAAVGSVVEIPDGFWVDVDLRTDAGLRPV